MDFINKFGERVGVMDQEDGLRILNYNECGRDSPEELKKIRGLVQDTDTDAILFETFPYTEEYNSNEQVPFFDELDGEKVLEEWDVFYSMEGCLLRVFWHNDRWYISTNKKLNAFKSRWASRKSFGDIFRDGLVGFNGNNENVLEILLDQMDKTLVHLFLVRYNHENRVVCSAPQDSEFVCFIGSWNNETKTLCREWKHPIKVSFPVPVREIPTTVRDLADSVDIYKHQGIILFHKHKNLQIKIYSKHYDRLYKLRGNNPNIRFRYLELRREEDTVRREFIRLYPLYEDMFLEYENILYQLSKLIRYYYIQRYIKNKYVTLPKEEYILMKKCHDWYLLDRTENKINVAKVLEILNKEEPLALYKMIRRFQINQYNQEQPKHHDNSNDMIQYPFIRNEPRAPRSVVSMEILPDSEE